ncbi:MAG: hypothetical protein ACREDR_00175 [Blastocatellia bacterium]
MFRFGPMGSNHGQTRIPDLPPEWIDAKKQKGPGIDLKRYSDDFLGSGARWGQM